MRLFVVASVLLAAATGVCAQPVPAACSANAVPVLVRSEGVAERVGDIVLVCSGTPGQQVSGNLTVLLNAVLGNRLSGSSPDVLLTIDNALANVTPQVLGNAQFVFPGLRFAYGPAGRTELRISNVRADATTVSGSFARITAQLAFDAPGLLNSTNSLLTVGVPERGLLASSVLSLVCSQDGSPVPQVIGFGDLIRAGTQFSSVRVTEGFATAFEPRANLATNGVRVLLRYTGVPSDARLFVPDFIAGANATTPTAAGDYGGATSGGRYTPGARSLLLARVLGADADGAGGAVAQLPGTPVAFDSANEVQVANGSAYAVFEVLDADGTTVESAQIPTFLGVPRSVNERSVTIAREVFFGPLSRAVGASPTAPVPRFSAVAPENDCDVRGDCSRLRPLLAIPYTDPLAFQILESSAAYRERYIYIENAAGGLLRWNARVEYKQGDKGWLRISPSSGTNSGQIRADIAIVGLAAGDYSADIVVDAAAAGLQRLPVTLRIIQNEVLPQVRSILNSATMAPGPIVPGSLMTLLGANLNTLVISFDRNPAQVLYRSNTQVNLLVPAALADQQSTSIFLSLGQSNGFVITREVHPVAPGIFSTGLLNQDYSVNAATNPASAGSILQVFTTGLLAPDGTGTVEAKLHDRTIVTFPYAAPLANTPGVQQVNIPIPSDLPTMTTELILCGTVRGQRACSPPVKLSICQPM